MNISKSVLLNSWTKDVLCPSGRVSQGDAQAMAPPGFQCKTSLGSIRRSMWPVQDLLSLQVAPTTRLPRGTTRYVDMQIDTLNMWR